MGKRFHESEFDDATQLKLAIFRGYIRRWLPVFLTARKSGRDQESVNVYDFFAGPGVDSKGNLGSPRIVQDELKAFCQKHGDMKAKGVKITLYFSDKKRRHIDALCECLKENSCPKGCCQFVLSPSSFQEAFAASLNRMRAPGTANRYVLENGFLPRHAKAHLETLQVNGKLEVTDPGTGEKVRKGAFYLSWKHYNAESVRAVFGLKE